MRRTLLALIGLLLLVAVITGVGYRAATNWLESPIAAISTPVIYELPRGASATTVARDLANLGLIEYPRTLAAWARFTGRATGIRAGEYEIQPRMSPQAIFELFRSGQVLLHEITFVEGSTFADIRQQLAEDGNLRHELEHTSTKEIMSRLGAGELDPEGQFFPDTYFFPKSASDFAILGLAHQRLRTALDAAWAERDPGVPLYSAYEMLILASIVEKETALERERPVIAGVFIERLKRGMRLQTDPTVIYGLHESYDGNLRKADLQRDTPYNTYTRAGLPPTPICLPGIASLRAAARPEGTGALFFVATGHGDGSHYFSKTLVEHNEAVQRFLKVLREQQSK